MPASSYNPYSVHANRGLGAWQRKQGNNISQFIWNGKTWSISPNTAKTDQTLTTGGIRIHFDLVFHCLTAQFFAAGFNTADLIRAEMLQNGGTLMSYLGGAFVAGQPDNYKIESVDITVNGWILVIGANSANENA